jgi:hypothetical protein
MASIYLVGVATVLQLIVMAAAQCTMLPNQNISQGNIAAPKFMVSAQDCCAACSETSGCGAAVYSNYYCSMKASLDGMVSATGSEVLFPSPNPAPTTSGPNETTTTTTTTAPAASTVVPSPMPVPTPPPEPWVIIREIDCEYSSHCNMSNDNSCSSSAYFNNTCLGKQKRICGNYHIHIEKYESEGCGGVVKSNKEEDENTCTYINEEGNFGHYCDVQKPPMSGIDMYRSDCNYGCDSQNCNVNNLKTGVCQTNPFSWLTGSSVIGWSFPQYVLWIGYGSIDCSGPIAAAIPEPHGCFESGYDFINNIVGSQ